MLAATPEGTANYKNRFDKLLPETHFRRSQGLWMSSIGLGTYLGSVDARTDEAYRAAVKRASELGCNVFDSAANYRCQRSERSVGEALAELFSNGRLSRDEVIVATKGGFIAFDGNPPRARLEMMSYLEETFVKPGVCQWNDFVQSAHCLTPGYLSHQLDQSLRNLKLDNIDVYYLHNPEFQLAEVSREEFYRRLHSAFEFLESAVETGKISMYGTATWDGYRAGSSSREYLSLEQVVNAARDVAGDRHHFRVVQLPVNLEMVEAFTVINQIVNDKKSTFLEAAAELGITVMTSASILQSRLASGLSPIVGEALKNLRTDAQRAIQFTRSTPGVTTALVGMSNISHVEENLETAKLAPASPEDYLKLFETA
jgi:aryl-alcohol dehydrogenase-like predicted oxidoreductase